MTMRNVADCRAQEPRTCYYHGAVIRMNEAIERIERSPSLNPADLDAYHEARTEVESAEREFEKQRWMGEIEGAHPQKRREEQPAKPATQEPATPPARRKPASGSRTRPQARTGAQRATGNRNSKNSNRSRRPLVPQPVGGVAYSEREFPVQASLVNKAGQTVILSRHDQAIGTPTGIMLGTSRKLSDAELTHLSGVLQYQHTVSTRENNKVKSVTEDDFMEGKGKRSVYMATQFNADGSQVKDFHDGLQKILVEGSDLRRDNTRKYPPFAEDVQVVVYYQT